MFKFLILPIIALALAWVFGRNPSARVGFLALAAWWGFAALLATIIISFALPLDEIGPAHILALFMIRIPYLLIISGPLVAVAAAILTSIRAPDAEDRREAAFAAAKTVSGATGQVAGGLAGSFFSKAAKEFMGELRKK